MEVRLLAASISWEDVEKQLYEDEVLPVLSRYCISNTFLLKYKLRDSIAWCDCL
jgi:hypothetical protein